MPIPKVKKMPERLKLLVLQGTKSAGMIHPADEALFMVEEQMTGKEFDQAVAFLNWCYKNHLTFGFGTIDLRWTEFKDKLTPVSRDEAYDYAIKQVGR